MLVELSKSQDIEAGDRLIARLKKIEKPVFSPHAPWYPVLAGHPPSAHLIALWDIDHEGGPFEDSVSVIELAIEQQKFGAILFFLVLEHYQPKTPRNNSYQPSNNNDTLF